MSSMYTQLGGVISSPFGQANQNLFNPGINQIGSPFLPQSGYGALSPLSGVSPFPSYPQPPAVGMPSLEQQYASFFRAGGPTSSYRPGPGLDPIWTGTPMTAGVKSGAPTGLTGPIGTKTTTKKGNPPGLQGPVTGKKGAAAPKQADPMAWLTKLMNSPPAAVGYTPKGYEGGPAYQPLITPAIAKALKSAYANQSSWAVGAINHYNEIASRVANSPDMTARAKKEATDWINSEIKVINKQQDREIAAGKRNAQQILSATGAAAQLQKSFGDNVGKSYADAAGVLATLGQGVGAGVTGAGNADLAAVGRVAPGALPASIAGVPAGAGSVVSTLGGALPAQNLAMQAAGVDRPGYVTGGAQNIVNQNAGLIQGAGGLQSIGAQRAGVAAASALNDKIFEAQAQYGPLFHQIFGDLTAHQDARNSQMMQLAQQGVTNAFQMGGLGVNAAENMATRYAQDAAARQAHDLSWMQHVDQLNASGQQHADSLTAQNRADWNAQVTRGLNLRHDLVMEGIAQQTADSKGQPKPLTAAATDKLVAGYSDAFLLNSGGLQFTNGATPGAYGKAEGGNGPNALLRPLISPPRSINEAYRSMMGRYARLIGPEGSKSWKEFVTSLKMAYQVPDWTNTQVKNGVGPIPGTTYIGKLPLNPFYTKDGGILKSYFDPENPEDHDGLTWDDPEWLSYFKKHGYQNTAVAAAKAQSTGGSSIPDWMRSVGLPYGLVSPGVGALMAGKTALDGIFTPYNPKPQLMSGLAGPIK